MNETEKQPTCKVEFEVTRNGVTVPFVLSKIKGSDNNDPITEFPCVDKEAVVNKNPQAIIDFLGVKEAAKIVYGKLRQWAQELYIEEAGVYTKVKTATGEEEDQLDDVRPLVPEVITALITAWTNLDARAESKKELIESKETLMAEFAAMSLDDETSMARLLEIKSELKAINIALDKKKKRTRGPNKAKVDPVPSVKPGTVPTPLTGVGVGVGR